MLKSKHTALTAAALVASAIGASSALAEDATVIELTQVPCQFLEPENGVDHEYTTTKKEDCVAINAETGDERLAASQTMNLPAGHYIFRVTNKDVPYSLGFWLRESDYDSSNPLHKLTKTSVSGGGLATGATLDYEVDLESGVDYVFSCPLNPTPDYRIHVE
jgi:hypothetical protein